MATSQVSQPGDDPGQLSGVVPRRLAAPADEADLAAVLASTWRVETQPVAMDWQGLGADAPWWEITCSLLTDHGRGFELAGLMASVGELLALGLGAAVESDLWLRYRDKQKLDLGQPQQRTLWTAHEMCQRTMAETSLFYLVSAGHGLVNVTARALALNPALHSELQQRCMTSFPAKSDERPDWLSLSTDTTSRLRQVARAAPTGPVWVPLAEPVSTVARDAVWKRVSSRRDEHWHRRRPQTAGLTGANKAGPWIEARPGVQRMTLGPDYTDGDNLATDLTLDTQAMLALLTANMTGLYELVTVAVHDLRSRGGM